MNWQGWGSGRARNSGNLIEFDWTVENKTGCEEGLAVPWLRFEDRTSQTGWNQWAADLSTPESPVFCTVALRCLFSLISVLSI